MTREELAAALRKADAAGNTDDARRLAGAIRQLDAGPAVQAPARPAMDPLHMVKPEARAQVQANQPMRSLPMSPLGPGNERYAPPKPPPQGDPLAPVNPQAAAANVDAQQRARGLVPYTNASTGETYWRPDPARQVADANAQFKAREAAKASAAQAQAENEAFRNSRPDFVNQASDAIRGGFAATENAAFDAVDAGLDVVDPRRKVSQFISQNVTPAAEQLGRGIGDFVEGPSGRFGGMAGPAVGAITGGLSELGATMARDPQDASTQIVDALEPTHQLARGANTTGDALDAAMGGDFGRSSSLMAQAVPDLIGGSGVLPAMSVTANALRTAARAPQRELAEQLARIQPLPATGRVPMSAPRAVAAASGAGGPPPAAPAAPGLPVPARSRAEQRADDIFIKKLEADGLTVEDLRKIQARLARRGDSGVYETSGELAALSGNSSGANVRGLQMAGGAAPGPLQEALVGIVNQNTEKLSPRLSRGATRATGQKADNAVATLDDLETRLRTEATPAYDTAYATPVNPEVFANEILPVLNTPSGQKALQAARNNLASIAADLQGRAARGASERATMESQRAQAAVKSIDDFMADPVRGTAIPTTMALDYTKRAFDDVIADAGFGSDTARIVGGTKRNFADSVSQATGGQYGNALGVFEDVKRLEDAFEVGTQALNKKTWELERELAKGRGGSPWTAGEVEALAMGVARNIEDLIEANNQSALTKLLKDKALKNMATALGSQKAADMFEETIRRLGANREWGRRVAGGSDTAMRQAAIRDAGMEGEDAITRVLDRVETSGNQFSLPGLVNDVAVKPIARTAKDIYQRLRYPGVYDEEVNRALIPLIGKPMTEANLNEVIRRVEARMAEKGLIPPAQPAAAAAPPPAPRRGPRGPRGNPPGTTSSASATGTGIVAGGVLGAMAPADDENEQFINALFTAAGVGTAAGVASKLSKGGKPPPASAKGSPKPPKGPPAKPAFDQRFMKEAQRIVSYNGGVDKALRAQQYVIDQLQNSKAPNAQDRINRAVSVQYAIRRMADRSNRELDEIAATAPPQIATSKPPPVKNGFGGKSLPMDEPSRMQRAREQGFDVDTPLYHGTGRDFDEAKGMFWGSKKPPLAEEYAAMRGSMGGKPAIIPYYARAKNTFDADDLPPTVTAGEFFNEVVAQAEKRGKRFSEAEKAELSDLIDRIRQGARTEESGPHYGRHDFWNDTVSLFGRDGKKAIDELFERTGFDSIKMIEDGQETLGVFDPSNIRGKFAKFDPSETQSSKLLAGVRGQPEAIGAGLGTVFAPDADGDGEVSFGERAGAAITGGVMGRGARAIGNRLGGAPKAPPAGKFRGPNNQTFAGVNAKTADKAALARAQNMEAEGASRDDIWDATGWFKGVDGKWRFEIDDSGATFAPLPRTPYMTELANQYARENFGVDSVIYLPSNDVRRAEAIQWATNESRKLNDAAKNQTAPLSERLNHPQLNSAYDLSDVKVGAENRSDLYGSYVPSSKTIRVADESPILGQKHDQFSTAIHETQHHLQSVEGFAKGGMPETALKEDLDAINARLSQIARSIDNRRSYRYDTGINTKQVEAEIEALKEEYNALLDRRAQEFSPQKEREAYKRLAGEAEARNVQERDAMRRRGEKPGRPWETQDVPDDQQIVRFGGGKAESRPKPPPTGNRLAKPKPPENALPPRLAADLNKSKVSPATRATLDQNAALPPGERKSVMEATGWSDEILRIAAPYIRPGSRMESEIGNRIARLVEDANANPIEYALRQTMAKGAFDEAQKRFKQASGARSRAETNLEKLRARNMLNPNQPATQQQLTVHKQRRDDAEQFLSEAARLRDEAKVMLDRADVELMSLEQVRAFANKEIQRITDALGGQRPKSAATAMLPAYNPLGPAKVGGAASLLPPKPPGGRPSKQAADELAHLLFEQDMADKFAKIQSGEITPTQRNTFQQVMSWYARHPSLAAGSAVLAGASGVGYAALATDQGERAVQARENARKRTGQPEPELPGPPAWDWEKLSRNPRFAGDTQAALQALGYKIGRIDNNIRRADGKRTESEKALYHFLWTMDNTRDPNAPPTEAEWDALKEAALQARRKR